MKTISGSILVDLAEWQKLQDQLNAKAEKEKNKMDGGIKTEADIITPTVKAENEIVHRMQSEAPLIKEENKIKIPQNTENNDYENVIKINKKRHEKMEKNEEKKEKNQERFKKDLKYSWKTEMGKCFADFLNN